MSTEGSNGFIDTTTNLSASNYSEIPVVKYDLNIPACPNSEYSYKGMRNASIEWKGVSYWAFDNKHNPWPGIMLICAYDYKNNLIGTREKFGARYLEDITINENERSVTFWGQGGYSIKMTWEELFELAGRPNYTVPSVGNGTADASYTEAKINGSVFSDGGADITGRGIVYSAQRGPTLQSNTGILVDSGTTGAISMTISGLEPNKNYFARIYATNMVGTSYSDDIPISTLVLASKPTLGLCSVDNITSNSANVSCSISSDGGAEIIKRGFSYYSASSAGTVDVPLAGTFYKLFNNLMPSTAYYVTAYAVNKVGTCYSNEITFTTEEAEGGTEPEQENPVLSVQDATYITASSASIEGNITSLGNKVIEEFGIVYSTSSSMNDNGQRIQIPAKTGPFTVGITGLAANTRYYTTTYYKLDSSFKYGTLFEFTTAAREPQLPRETEPVVITQSDACSTTKNSLINIKGTVPSDGGSQITEYGFVCALFINPKTDNYEKKVSLSGGQDSFSAVVDGLKPNTTYYVRAYATNIIGTSYGESYGFRTEIDEIPPSIPEVRTKEAVTEITSRSAIAAGTVISDGGSDVTERGIVYSKGINPQTAEYAVTVPTRLNNFSAKLTNLEHSTTYNAWAYAKNIQGIKFGNMVSFTTSDVETAAVYSKPEIKKGISVFNISSGSAIVEASATSETAAVTQRGFFYKTLSENEWTNAPMENGGRGSFQKRLEGLKAGTIYMVKAYAQNVAGLSEGEGISFTTLNIEATAKIPTVTTNDPAIEVKSTSIKVEGNVVFDGGTNITERGFVYATSQDPTTGNTISPVILGGTTGQFTAIINGLTPVSTYYVRAYAKNSVGISYGKNLRIYTTDEQVDGYQFFTGAYNIKPKTVTYNDIWFNYNTNSPDSEMEVLCNDDVMGSSINLFYIYESEKSVSGSPDKAYFIISKDAGMYLTLAGDKVVFKKGTGEDNQKWNVHYRSSGYYEIIPGIQNGKRLSVNGGNVGIADQNASDDAQKWKLTQEVPSGSSFTREYTDINVPVPVLNPPLVRRYDATVNQGFMGKGWMIGFQGRLFDYTYTYDETKGPVRKATVVLPDCSTIDFEQTSMKSEGSIFEIISSIFISEYRSKDLKSYMRRYVNPLTSEYIYEVETDKQYKYQYDKKGYLTQILDPYGNKVFINTDKENGRVNEVVYSNGRYLNFEYNEQNKLVRVYDVYKNNIQRRIQYEYENDLLVKFVDSEQREIHYTYDVNGLLCGVCDKRGNVLERVSIVSSGNNFGRVQRYTDAFGNTKEYKYSSSESENDIWTEISDSQGRTTKSVTDLKNFTQTNYDEEGNATITKYGVSFDNSDFFASSLFGIIIDFRPVFREILNFINGDDSWNHISCVIDKYGNITNYETDEWGNVTKITNPDGSFKKMWYEKFGTDDKINKLAATRDEEGYYTCYQYDENGILLKECRYTVQVSPNENIKLTEDNKKQFIITSYEYCSAGNVKGLISKITEPSGNATEYRYYDTDGLLKNAVSYQYLPDGQKSESITSYEYDNYGYKSTEISPNGYKTEYVNLSDGNVRTITQNSKKLNSAGVFEPGNEKCISEFSYDYMGRQTKLVSPEGYSQNKGQEFTYFTSGKVEAAKDPYGNITCYSYNKYGNTSTMTTPEGAIYTYLYDRLNRLISVSFKDDASSKPVILEEYSYGSVVITNPTYTYRKHPTKSSTRYLNERESARSILEYDFAGRVVKQTDPDNSCAVSSYYKNGGLKTTVGADGVETSYLYDSKSIYRGTYLEKRVKLSDTAYSCTKFQYDAACLLNDEQEGLIEKNGSQEGFTPLAHKQYEYYPNDMLKCAKKAIENINECKKIKEYVYDKAGNVAGETDYKTATESVTASYTSNFLGKPEKIVLAIRKGDIFGNDFNDNSVDTITTFNSYDKNGNLIAVTTPDKITTKYTYDLLSRKTGTSKTCIDEYGNTISATSFVTYDYAGNVTSDSDAFGNTVRYEYDKRGNQTKIISTVKRVDGIDGEDTPLTVDLTEAMYYDRAGRRIAIVAPKDFDAAKSLEQMNRTVYTYDLTDRLVTESIIGKENIYDGSRKKFVEIPLNIVNRAYLYNGKGQVVKTLDALGYEAGTGSTVQEKINSGYGTEYWYDIAGRLTAARDPETKEKGQEYKIKYEYDALGRVKYEFSLKGNEDAPFALGTAYLYNPDGTVREAACQRVKTDGTDYQGEARITIKTNTYDFAGNVLTSTDAMGYRSEYEYNTFGKLRRVILPGDETIPPCTQWYQYDCMGRLARSVSPYSEAEDREDLFTYDTMGMLLSHTRKGSKSQAAEAVTTYITYDKNGNKRFETDGNGNKAEFVYDSKNRLKQVLAGSKDKLHKKTYKLDANDNVISYTESVFDKVRKLSADRTTQYHYDQLNRMIEEINPDKISILKINYNHNSAQSEGYDACDRKISYSYDKIGRIIKTTDYLTSQTQRNLLKVYDLSGNVCKAIDAKGNATEYSYNMYDDLSIIKVSNGSYDEITEFCYDLNGNMVSQTDGNGNTTSFRYNSANKLAFRIDPDGFKDKAQVVKQSGYSRIRPKGISKEGLLAGEYENYLYWQDGNLKRKIDRNGNCIEYSYNVHGSNTSINAPGIKIEYSYDKNGNLVIVKDETGITQRSYDYLNRVTIKIVPVIGKLVKEYDRIAYSDEGYLAYSETTIDPRGNSAIMTYDSCGRLRSVKEKDGEKGTVYDYYQDGRRYSITYPGGGREFYKYDEAGRLNLLVNLRPDNSVIHEYHYEYDKNDNITKKFELLDNGEKNLAAYNYDNLNRLAGIAIEGKESVKYIYDRAGNRAVQVNYAEGYEEYNKYDNKNRLMEVAYKGKEAKQNTYKYDLNGNVIVVAQNGKEIQVNYYDSLNRLRETVSNGAKVINYYNGEGKRVVRKVNDFTCLYFYDGDNVILEADVSGNQLARNVYGTNLISRTYKDEKLYYMYNGHGDVTALINEAGKVSGTYSYDEFGRLTHQKGNMNNPYTYAGYHYDRETELYYLNSRMYDPKIARFLQEDTYWGDPNDPLTLNLYAYCHNNPLIYTDPSGYFSWNPFSSDFYTKENWDEAGNAIKGVADKVADGIKEYGERAASLAISAGMIAGGIAVAGLSFGAASYIGAGMIGAGISGAMYTATNWNNFSWKGYGISAAIGFGGGLLGAGAGSSIMAGALAGAAESYVSNGVETGEWAGNGALQAAALGGLGGFMGAAAGKALGKVMQRSALLKGCTAASKAANISFRIVSGAGSGAATDYVVNGVQTGEWSGEGAGRAAYMGAISGAVGSVVDVGADLKAGRFGQCFVAGTLVFAAEGLTAIENIKAGDMVYAEDVETGEKGLKRVSQVFVSDADVLVYIKTSTDEIIATVKHPFYVEGKGWREAQHLLPGDRIKTREGSTAEIKTVDLLYLDDAVKVYNFEVEAWHTYYVGSGRMLVHNDCEPYKNKKELNKLAEEIEKSDKGGRNKTYAVGKTVYGSYIVASSSITIPPKIRERIIKTFKGNVFIVSGRGRTKGTENLSNRPEHMHAEEVLLGFSRSRIELVEIGSSRRYCKKCAQALKKSGFSTLKEDSTGKETRNWDPYKDKMEFQSA